MELRHFATQDQVWELMKIFGNPTIDGSVEVPEWLEVMFHHIEVKSGKHLRQA